MDSTQAKRSVAGSRNSLRDISILIVILVVGLYLTFEYDIFKSADGKVHARTIELDEGLMLGAVMAFALLAIGMRRYAVRKRDAVLRLATEEYVQTPAFQKALTGIANSRKSEEERKALLTDVEESGLREP